MAELLPRLPSKEQRDAQRAIARNPIKIIMSLTLMQHLLFTSSILAWMTDAFDFFSVSLTVTRLQVAFNEKTTSITLAITLTLLFRSLGAVIFGLASDRYGRKWVMVINLLIIAALELGTSFTQNFSQFLACRSLFGIGMGGIWGLAASNGLENLPLEARGFYSGLLQEGYAIGYLFAAVINLKLVPEVSNTWRALYQLGAGYSLAVACFRALLPESQYFLDQRAKAKALGETSKDKTKIFLREAAHAVKTNWARCIFAVCLMTGFNFFSHASQDIAPTFYQLGKLFTSQEASKLVIISNCGAVTGGVIAGFLSQFLGRRITIICCCIWTLCWIPLFTLPDTFSALAAGGFMVQVGVQGAWGVIPIYLSELSPPAFRAVWPGLAYQLGNMASSGSSQIEADGVENLKTMVDGKVVPDYAKVLQIFVSVIAGYIILLALFGVEAHSVHFEKADAAFLSGAGNVQTHNNDNMVQSEHPEHVVPSDGFNEKHESAHEAEKATYGEGYLEPAQQPIKDDTPV